MSNDHNARHLLTTIADRTRRFDFTLWFWGDPIAFDGLVEASELTGEARFADHAEKYFKRWAEAGMVGGVDINCPGYALLKIYQRTNNPRYLEMAERLADFLHNKIPRSLDPECPIYQPERVNHRNYAWVDSIYHVPPFLCHLARVTSKEAYYEWGVYVLDTHVNALLDRKTMIFPQGRDLASETIRGYGWGRGMGWAYLGLIDTYGLLPEDHPARPRIKDLFLAMSSVLLGYQDSSGAWRNLIHDREAPLEASTAAMLGGGFEKAVRLGWLGNEYEAAAERSWQYVVQHIDERGGFYNVSAASWVAPGAADDIDVYKRFYTEVNVWGQGAAMRAAIERILSGKD